ncbi:single-stranded DNA-binding protein [Lysobacter capsici]|uniref:single-stranded DNA-binding protein n=1 Tax=Lysobacter capsici TaxID=435897 RepID=UPI00287B81DB|nr:single-stranded DNA-binding protein [Lysobacter capsici]WND83112.1 single-stranded DNA-binding protein [Lysobacter capsici]WND88311.1 single-stranded DNA-binding protein [Lysobacter capsici]
MIKLQILSAAIEERGGTIQRGERKGESYHIKNQEGYVHNGHAFPERCKISLGELPPLQPAMYYLDPASIEIGEYGDLRISRSLKLLTEDEAIAYLREQLPSSMLAKLAGPVDAGKPSKPAQAT